MYGDPASVRTGVAQGHPDADRSNMPPAFARNPWGQPAISIDGRHELLNVNEIRLELDDEKGASRRMKCEDIDDPALTVDRKRGLRGKQPRRACKHSRHALVKRGMSGIQHAIEIAATPSRQNINPDLERLRNSHERGEADAAHMPTLDARNHCLRNLRCLGDVDLAPTLPYSNRPKDRSQSHEIHPRILRSGGLLPHYCSVIRRTIGI